MSEIDRQRQLSLRTAAPGVVRRVRAATIGATAIAFSYQERRLPLASTMTRRIERKWRMTNWMFYPHDHRCAATTDTDARFEGWHLTGSEMDFRRSTAFRLREVAPGKAPGRHCMDRKDAVEFRR